VQDYNFARDLRSVPVTLAEAASAASCFPLVFVLSQSRVMPHALLRRGVQGLSPFIGQDGQWQATWLPPRIAAWPFDLLEEGGGHALALHATSDLVFEGPGGATGIFAEGGAFALSAETARIAAVLKVHAEALPATSRATTALQECGILTGLDADASIFTVDPVAAADLGEADVLSLHRAGALALLHAGLVSLAHLPWMEKAEKRLVAALVPKLHLLPDRKRVVAGSSFLKALAAENPADEALIQFSGSFQS
jgi:hypothetical protein